MSDDQNSNSMKRKAVSICTFYGDGRKSVSYVNGHMVSLSDELIGKIFSFLKLYEGPLQLKQTCNRFSSLPVELLVRHSHVDQQVFVDSLLLCRYSRDCTRSTRKIQDVIRKLRGIADIPNCGHCDHSNRFAVEKCPWMQTCKVFMQRMFSKRLLCMWSKWYVCVKNV
jgi:hypothetical protein